MIPTRKVHFKIRASLHRTNPSNFFIGSIGAKVENKLYMQKYINTWIK